MGFLRKLFGILNRSETVEERALKRRREMTMALDRTASNIVATALAEILSQEEFALLRKGRPIRVNWSRRSGSPNERSVWSDCYATLVDVTVDVHGQLSFAIVPPGDLSRAIGPKVKWMSVGSPMFCDHPVTGSVKHLDEWKSGASDLLRDFNSDFTALRGQNAAAR